MRKLFFVVAVACTSNQSSTSSQVTGTGTYRDAATTDSGQPQQPAQPSPQQANVSIVMNGTGTITQVDPRCATDPVGAFVATYSGTAQLSNGGAYVAGFGSTSGTITTPSGCAIQNLTVNAMTGAKVVADLQITTENCTTYCQASARADAEASCGATPTSASCRAQMETSLASSCQTTCTSQAHSIRAEASVGAAAIGQLTAEELKTAAFGDVQASLVFSELVDANGNKL